MVRIVKLSFKDENIPAFLTIFENSKLEIRKSKGCRLLELYRDKSNKNVFFTYSHWDAASDLNNYRNSSFFKKVWSQTKVLFNEKPEAWSVDKLEQLH